jgi:hypothetical protein
VLLQLKAKDLANAEAENCCRYAYSSCSMGLILIPLLIQLRLKSILALKKKLGVESRALKASHDKADLDLIDAKNLRVKK